MQTQLQENTLTLASIDTVSQDLALTDPKEITASGADSQLSQQADGLIDRLLTIDASDLREQQRQAGAVQSLGFELQAEIARKSAMLKQPMSKLMSDAEDGGDVAKSLLALQENVSKVNPNEVDFQMGGLRKLLSKLPWIGTPLSQWLARYQSVEGVIQDVVKSLDSGKGQLERDNITLTDDQVAMRELTIKLQDYAKFGQFVDQRLAERLDQDSSISEERRKFLQEEIQFPLRQRILDLQQQLAVNQQGVLTTEVIVRNNRELIRGVSRALNVTVPALTTASTLALALQTQKKVLEGTQAVAATTDDLIGQTANKLKTQGVEIQKQAASAMLDTDKLKAAFADVQSALDDISSFRREALPQLAQSVLEMDELTGKMESSIKSMEEGAKASAAFRIELE